MASKKFEGIFFDAGNTLLRVHPSVGHIYADTARRYGADLPVEQVEASFKALWTQTAPLVTNDGHRLSYERERDWWRDIVHHVFVEHVRFQDFDAFFNELYDRFAQHDTWKVYDDVIEILDTLSGLGYRLAMISNWDSRLPELIESLGLRRYFESVVVSALVGYEKPHPAIFQIALEQTGMAPENTVYIGDDLFLDYQAARKTGMSAIHLDRQGRFDHHDDRICSLHELLPRI